jgi:hypothetical protein
MTTPGYLEVTGALIPAFTVAEQDFPPQIRHLRVLAWPVQGVSSPANLYMQASLVVKANFGGLGYIDNEWQSVYANIPFDIFEPDDLILDVCPSFLVGGMSRQETPLLHSDTWGLAVDEISRITQVVERTLKKNMLVLDFEIKNLGQSQMPDLCLMIDALVYRPSLRQPEQAHAHSWRYSRLRDGDAAKHIAQTAVAGAGQKSKREGKRARSAPSNSLS